MVVAQTGFLFCDTVLPGREPHGFGKRIDDRTGPFGFSVRCSVMHGWSCVERDVGCLSITPVVRLDADVEAASGPLSALFCKTNETRWLDKLIQDFFSECL